MYNFEVKTPPAPVLPQPTAADMKIGDLAVVLSGFTVGHVLLRSYNSLCDLSDPKYFWENYAQTNIKVRILSKDEKVTLTIA